MSIFDEPKIDCHNHVFDPVRFEFSPKAYYFPTGAELGTRSQLTAVFEAYGVQRALVIQPNSGYDDDNRCLIDVLAHGEGRLRGMAVIANDASRRELERVRAADKRRDLQRGATGRGVLRENRRAAGRTG